LLVEQEHVFCYPKVVNPAEEALLEDLLRFQLLLVRHTVALEDGAPVDLFSLKTNPLQVITEQMGRALVMVGQEDVKTAHQTLMVDLEVVE
jgi:hypothetical protein